MTNTTTTIEPIAADPVLIDASDAQKSTLDESPSTMKDDLSEISSEYSDGEGSVAEFVTRTNMPRPPPPRVYRQGRGSARFIPDRDLDEIPIISNTKQFNALLSQPDICVETVGSCDTIYISTTPFHDADVQKLAWLFKLGIPDAWVQKPTSYVSGSGFQFDLPRGGRRQYHDDDRYDDGYNSRDIVSHARLGAVLRIFKDDSEKYRTSKVKFITAVHKERTSGAWVKLIVSHTRQAAAVDIFHQILNNQSILFVGAVLQDMAVPVETSSRKPVKVQKVNSVKEAEEVGKGVIGVIC
jgi:hypothetical protein